MINITNVKEKMKWIRDEDNIFKKITQPRKSLMDYSNELTKEAISMDKEMWKEFNYRRPVDLENFQGDSAN